MSAVNIKIIFVKKQKQTRERSTQGRGANSFITEMALFTPETDHSCETGYPFDNSRQICNIYVLIWKWNCFNFKWTICLTLSANFDGQFEDGWSVLDSLCTAAPSLQKKKKRKRGVCGGGGDWTQASVWRMIHFLALVWKRPTTKFPCPVFLMIQKGLYRTTVFRDLSVL